MKHQKYLAALTAALLLTSCGTDEITDESTAESHTESAASETSEAIRELQAETPAALPDITDARIYFGDDYFYPEESQLEELAACCEGLTELPWQSLTVYDSETEWKITLNAGHSLSRVRTSEGWVILSGDTHVYADNPALNAYIIGLFLSDMPDIPDGPAEYFSIACSEPATEDEYRETAVALLDAWLTDLQKPDTDDEYRNTGYEISQPEDYGTVVHHKNNYLASGMVDGVKEFCVELCFTAEDCGDGTFYDRHYQEGRYTAAGTFWSGNYICGRFRWQNGTCTLIDMASTNSERILQGLNGIPQGGYRNFYDYVRQADIGKQADDSFIPYGNVTVSKNLTMTKDGREVHIDLYSMGNARTDGDTVTAVMHERSYDGEEKLYSSGVYFTDNGTGVKSLTLPAEFRLTFDNYDGDGNPDYCVKYDEDADGAYYVLESLQTDGRIFNLSGRAYEGGIYLAGCFDASPRLQRTADIPYIGWKTENGRYYPTGTNGNEIELPALNMYSDRLYLPDDMKLYSENEQTVHCFLWNNTDSDVTTDTAYAIEMYEGGQWIPAADGMQGSAVTIAPRSCADIAYDISALKDRTNTAYRIVQQAGGETAYGSFYSAGRATVTFAVTLVSLTDGALSGSFAYTDDGLRKTSITSAVIHADSTDYPLHLTADTDGTQAFLLADGKTLPAGDYTITVNGTASLDFQVTDAASALTAAVSAQTDDNAVTVTFTPDADCTLNYPMLYRLKDGAWQLSLLYNPDLDADFFSGDGEIHAGETVTIPLKNMTSEDGWADELFGFVEEYFAEANEEEAAQFADYGITYHDGMTLEEFTETIIANNSIHPDDPLLTAITLYDTDGNSVICMTKHNLA